MLRTPDGPFSRPQTAFARSSSVRSLHLSSLLSETVSCDRDRAQMSFSPNSHELASPSGMSLPRSGAGPITLLMAVKSICKAASPLSGLMGWVVGCCFGGLSRPEAGHDQEVPGDPHLCRTRGA